MRSVRPLAVLLALTSLAVAADVSNRDFYNAIRQNDLAQLKQLLAAGSDVNLRDPRGSTPLMQAAAIGSLEAMKLLLKAGADVNAKNGLDATALIWGASDPAKVRLLVDAGAGVNARSKIGRTPLVIAAGSPGSTESVRLLLSKGADPKAADFQGTTALVGAARANDLDTMRLLLTYPVDINAGDFGGLTALIHAAGLRNLTAVKLLLEKGADVNASHKRDIPVKNGLIALSYFTALMTAPETSPEILEVLLNAGANVNAKDIRGMTPLMLAVACDAPDPRIVKMLLDRGADQSVKSGNGELALDWARKFNHAEIVRLLGGETASAKAMLLPAADRKQDLRDAVGRSVTLLQANSTQYFKQSGCVGCHHQTLAAVAVASARRNGFRVDETAAAEQTRVVKSELLSAREVLLQNVFISVDGLAFEAMQLNEQAYPADDLTDAIVSTIASQQTPAGNWNGLPLVRPPLEDSVLVRTAFAVRALAQYGIPARKVEFDARIAKARQWLLEAKPERPYERTFQLLGLKWSGADARAIERAAGEVRGLQGTDGGWAQLRTLPSDAYATGTALYALRQAGVSPQGADYQRGVRFLLSSQRDDGSWHVRSRAPKVQPYFQSGFPHDHDQWISAAATAWATAALAEAVEPSRNSAGPVKAIVPF
jgi:ankyrin repeat protein